MARCVRYVAHVKKPTVYGDGRCQAGDDRPATKAPNQTKYDIKSAFRIWTQGILTVQAHEEVCLPRKAPS